MEKSLTVTKKTLSENQLLLDYLKKELEFEFIIACNLLFHK